MKKELFKFMTLAAVVAMSVSLASCGGDDNDAPEIPSKPVCKSVTAAYEASLSEDFLKFYDATIIFTDADGKLMQGPLTKDEKFGYTIPVAKLPEKISFAIKLKAKTPIPEIDESANYTFGKSAWMKVTGNLSDGSKSQSITNGLKNSTTKAGSGMSDYLEKNPELMFGPYECPTDQFINQK